MNAIQSSDTPEPEMEKFSDEPYSNTEATLYPILTPVPKLTL